MRVVVVGAGAFGGWTALSLRRRGAGVTLLDAWGPGNARASSGGRTRVVRATYGSHAVYTRMAARAMSLWKEHDARSGTSLYHQTGGLWLFGDDRGFADASAAALHEHGLPFESLTLDQARARYPQFSFDGVTRVMLEPDAGFVFARRACRHVVERFVAEGGRYLTGAVASPAPVERGARGRVTLISGETLDADTIVYACGPWLQTLFPEVVGNLIRVTRQEVYYFGPPPGDARYTPEACPVWLHLDDRLMYGIPEAGGFKVANDTPGIEMDPTSASRAPSAEGIADARAFLARRVPGLAAAPLVGAEVCQYESTQDANFIIDRHPAAGDVWIVGGGSGHGFKMGPAIGELLASLLLDGVEPDPAFRLARFAAPPPGGWPPKWS